MKLTIENIAGVVKTTSPIPFKNGQLTLIRGKNGHGKTSVVRAAQAILTRGDLAAAANPASGKPTPSPLNHTKEGTATAGRAKIVFENGSSAWVAPDGSGLNWKATGIVPPPASRLSHTELDGLFAAKKDVQKQWTAMIAPPDFIKKLEGPLAEKYDTEMVRNLISKIRLQISTDNISEGAALEIASAFYSDQARAAKQQWSRIANRIWGSKIGGNWLPENAMIEVVESQRGKPIDLAAIEAEIAAITAKMAEDRDAAAQAKGRIAVTDEMLEETRLAFNAANAAFIRAAGEHLATGQKGSEAVKYLEKQVAETRPSRRVLIEKQADLDKQNLSIQKAEKKLEQLQKQVKGKTEIDLQKDKFFVCGNCKSLLDARGIEKFGSELPVGVTATFHLENEQIAELNKLKEHQILMNEAVRAAQIEVDLQVKKHAEIAAVLDKMKAAFADLATANLNHRKSKEAHSQEQFIADTTTDSDEVKRHDSERLGRIETIRQQVTRIKNASEAHRRVIADEALAYDLSTKPDGIVGSIMGERYELVENCKGMTLLGLFDPRFNFNRDKAVFMLDGRAAISFSRSEIAMVTIAIRAIAVELNADPMLIIDGLDIIDDTREGVVLQWLMHVAHELGKPVLVTTSTTGLEPISRENIPPVLVFETQNGVVSPA